MSRKNVDHLQLKINHNNLTFVKLNLGSAHYLLFDNFLYFFVVLKERDSEAHQVKPWFMWNSQVIAPKSVVFSTIHRPSWTCLPHKSYKILKENPPPIKSEPQIQRVTLNKPSNANELNQVLKLAEELRIT